LIAKDSWLWADYWESLGFKKIWNNHILKKEYQILNKKVIKKWEEASWSAYNNRMKTADKLFARNN
jgi:hypothetical protein